MIATQASTGVTTRRRRRCRFVMAGRYPTRQPSVVNANAELRERGPGTLSEMLALLDLDGTLVDRDAGFALWARWFVEDEDLDAGALGWLEETDHAVRERGHFFTLVREHFGTSRDADGLWDDYRAQMPLLTVAFPGVIAALASLRAGGWRLVVVTNGRMDNQLGKLRRSGIIDLLDGCCVSEEIGIRKPDPVIFTIARERLGILSNAQCWVVGDDPELDVAGGRSSGMRTIWVSHGRSWPAGDYRPDRTAETPAAALAVLGTTT
jgi:putative hydrolase of the HAD superfamily